MTSSKISFHIRIPADQVEEAQTVLNKLGAGFDPWNDMISMPYINPPWLWAPGLAGAIKETNRTLREKKVGPLIPEDHESWSLEQTWELMEISNVWHAMLYDESIPCHLPSSESVVNEWRDSMREWQIRYSGDTGPQMRRPKREESRTPSEFCQDAAPREIRPIRNEEDYEGALERIQQIYFAGFGSELGDEREILENLLELYELKNHPAMREEEYKSDTKPGRRPIRDEGDYRNALKRIKEIDQAETRTELENERDTLLDLAELYELKHPRMPRKRKNQTAQPGETPGTNEPRQPARRKHAAA